MNSREHGEISDEAMLEKGKFCIVVFAATAIKIHRLTKYVLVYFCSVCSKINSA